MKSSETFKTFKENLQLGRVIAQGIREDKVEKAKNMAKAEKRKQTMLEQSAEKALSGTN